MKKLLKDDGLNLEKLNKSDLMKILVQLLSKQIELKEFEEQNKNAPSYRVMTINELVEWSKEQGSTAVNYGLINRWIKEGKLKATTSGNRKLIRLENFQKLLDGEYMEDKEFIRDLKISELPVDERYKVAV